MELTGTRKEKSNLVTETLRLRRLRTQTLRLRGGLPSLEAEETSNPDPEADEGSYPDPEAHTKHDSTYVEAEGCLCGSLRWSREGGVTLGGDMGIFFLEGLFTKCLCLLQEEVETLHPVERL